MSLLQQVALRSGLCRALRLQHVAAAASSLLAAGGTSSLQQWRPYSSGKLDDYQSEIESINEKFVEARDEIEYAMEDAETVYFNESCDEAKEAVQVVLDLYQALRDKLDPAERGKLERSMGLKIEQLKAEAAQLDTLHAD